MCWVGGWGGGRSPCSPFTFQTLILLTCLANTAISSLNDSDEQTSPPATPGSRGVQVANSHFSKISAKRGKRGCLQENTTVTNNTMVSPESGGRGRRAPQKSSRRSWRQGPPSLVLPSTLCLPLSPHPGDGSPPLPLRAPKLEALRQGPYLRVGSAYLAGEIGNIC